MRAYCLGVDSSFLNSQVNMEMRHLCVHYAVEEVAMACASSQLKLYLDFVAKRKVQNQPGQEHDHKSRS